ncbi:MAG: glycosyltransferase [Acidobacteria bacterium]|nr:glycosyltransferase [Acidobacteriota bacterium]
MPHITVVIPVFNASPLIGAALRSVFGQTYRDFEVIVIDDGSDDETELVAALHEWAGRIVYIRQPNAGPARARNVGITRASGQLIAFLDADDEWLPEKLEKQVAYFDHHPETGLLHTGLIGDGLQASSLGGPPRPAFCDLFHTRFFVNTLTVMIPAAVLQEVGDFDERREIHIEDWDLWLRIAARHPFGYLPEPLAFHRPGGYMSRQIDRTYASQLLVMEKNHSLCGEACTAHRLSPAQCDRERRYVLHRDWGYDRLQTGNRRGAREQFRLALGYSPTDPRAAVLYAATFARPHWLSFVRQLSSTRPLTASAPPPAATQTPDHGRQRISLVHDTIYRRLRRRAISRLHDIDDGIFALRQGRKRILFDAASPMSLAVFRPLYERVRRDSRLEFWFTALGKVWTPQQVFEWTGVRENVISSSTASRMKVHLYINTDFWDMTWLPRRARRMHLFHGVAGKYGLDAPVDLAPTIATFDALLFANADRRRRYIEACLVPDDRIKAALVGYPKVDCLVDGSLDTSQIRHRLGLAARCPTVIYAPTWSPSSSLNGPGEEIVDRLAAEGLQVIVKLHDRSYDRGQRGSGGVDWATRLAKYDSHPRVRVVREADSSPFLAVADAMVSDHSSIAFEYMLLDRPLVVIDRPELLTAAAISPDKIRRLRSAADVTVTAAATARAIVQGLSNPRCRSAERQQVARELFYRPGTAADRAVALLYHLLELPAPVQAQAGLSTDAIETVAAAG